MVLKKIKLEASNTDTFVTELKFEIAIARSDQYRLLRVEILEAQGSDSIAKFYSSVKKELKLMKQKGIIQLFAFPESFENNTTESVFLINKYPEYVNIDDLEMGKFLFLLL